jgi:phosphate uptake regulator
MKRKVIQIAESTQLVSLPRQWAKAHNIKRGQEIDVEEVGNTVVISTDSSPPKRNITIDLSGLLPRLADRFLARAYQLGFDEVDITFDSLELCLALRAKVPELLGFEIFEQDHHRIVIKSIASTVDIDFDSALRRGFTVALGMSDAYLEAFKNKNRKELETLHYRDLELNKFCYFCLRAINRNRYPNFDSHVLYYLIETLEDVGDAYKELGTALAKINYDSNIANLLENVNNGLRMSYNFFYKPDKTLVLQAYNVMQDTQKSISKQLTNVKSDAEIKVLIILDYLLRLIYHYPTMRLSTLKELNNS